MMAQVGDYMMSEAQYEALVAEAQVAYESEDSADWDSYEEFEEHYLLSALYPED